MPRRGAGDAVAAVNAAAEDLFRAGKSWARYLKEREAEQDDQQSTEAKAIAREIDKLRKSIGTLAERLQAASSA
jgi:hypothetical protein